MYIKTKRLVLKPMSAADVPVLAELLADEVVKRTYMVPDFTGPEETAKLAGRLINLSCGEDRYVAGIYLRERLIGILNETEVAGQQIEIGYALLPRYHNQGYCTETLGGAIGYFFARGFREVVAGASSENGASIRVMEKNGMEKLARTDEIDYRGRTHTCVYYAAKR